MLFELITGGAGAGKSTCIEDKIEECITLGKRAVVIVPERFSHIEERTLCESFGGLGLNSVEVTTFSKLSRCLQTEGEYLSPTGREMLVMKAAKENASAGDGIFDGAYERVGFVEQLSDTITELKRSLVTPEMLASFELGGFLGRKLSAVGAVFAAYNAMFNDKLKDPDENMARLAEIIEADGGFSDVRVFIDGFSDFMPVHYKVIESLIRKSDSVTVVLTINDDGLRDSDGIYAPVAHSAEKLVSVAKECGATVVKKHLGGEYGYIKSEDIRYFLSNYDCFKPIKNIPICENIMVNVCTSRREEVERAAGRIMYEIRENGLRFRDIGVIVGKPDSYQHIIDSVFNEYSIPYFTDSKMSALEHPAVRTVLAVFKILNENWSFKSVFEYLRSGFIYKKTDSGVYEFDRRGIDRLEIYCRTRGIRGKDSWLSEKQWKPLRKGLFDAATEESRDNDDIEELDSLRRELMLPFVKLTEKIKGRRRVKELTVALYEFLDDICLYDGLTLEKQKLEKENMLDDAARIGEAWNAILETFDQAVITCGDEYMSRQEYAHMLESGFSKCSIDTVPPGIDRVSVGRADMSRPVKVKALLVLGAVRGELPAESGDGGIITDADRMALSMCGYDILQDRQTKMQIAEFNIFSSLTAACERIYISYPARNDEGANTTPAGLVGEVERCFGSIDAEYTKESEWENILSSGKSAYNKMISRISSDISDKEREFWNEIWKYTEEEAFQSGIATVKKADRSADLSLFDNIDEHREDILSALESYKNGKTHIKPSTAAMLYSSDGKFSITALQRYNVCPFSYFARYGLRLGDDAEYKVGGSDIGKMVHWAVCEYCRKVQETAVTNEERKHCWEDLDEESSGKIIKSIIDDIERQSLEANPYFCVERLRTICKKVSNTIQRSAKIIRESLISGGFSAVEFEKDFSCTLTKDGESVNIEGIIDRLDVAEDGNGKLLRVIDYKTGNQKFSVADICNKTDLQLIVYALAAQQMYKDENARVAAVMYDKVRDEPVKTELGAPAAISVAPLDGVIVTEGDFPSDDEMAVHDAVLAEKNTKSSFLPLQTKKGGGIKKSGTVISRARFNMLARYVTKTAVETKRMIEDGSIAAYPSGEGEYSPCTWCEYSSVCLHDKDRDGIRPKLTSASKAWEKIEMEDSDE